MISLETGGEPRRQLIRPETLLVDPETGNVFGLPQRLSVPTSSAAVGVAPMQEHQAGEGGGPPSDLMREAQRRAAYASVQKYPRSAHVLNTAGQTMMAIGDFKAAVEFFRRVLQEDPSHRVGKFNLARALTLLRQFEEGERLYRELLEEPASLEGRALKNLAQLLMATNRFEEAEDLLSKALRQGERDAGAYNERAVARLARGRANEAIHDLRLALKLNVRFPAAHNNLGVCYLQTGSPERALRSFRAALTLDRTYADAVLNLASVAEQRGLAEQASRILEEYLSLQPQDVRAIDALARLFIIMGKAERSLKLMKQLLRQSDVTGIPVDLARVLNNMGVAHAILGDLDAAAECFRQSMAKGAVVCSPYCNMAELLLRRGKADQAKAVLTEALDRYREDPRALQMLANYYVQKDLPQAAVDCLRRVMAVSPSDWLTYAWLSSVLADEFEDYDEAVQVARNGLKLAPEARLLKNNLAYILLMKGAKAEARRVLATVEPVTSLERVVLTATRGLLALREGHLEEGSRLYNEAARLATDSGTQRLARQKKAVELARAYIERGDLARAETLLREGVKIQAPHNMFRHQAERLQRALGVA